MNAIIDEKFAAMTTKQKGFESKIIKEMAEFEELSSIARDRIYERNEAEQLSLQQTKAAMVTNIEAVNASFDQI